MLVHAGIHQYILAYTSMHCALRHWNFFEICKWIHHHTRQYMEVGKSPVPLNEMVQGSTRTSYCLVPSCTVSLRGTGHLGTVPILQCTALYRDVSTNGFQRNFSVSKHSTWWYMPVYTGIHQHVPAYTNMTLGYFIVPPCTVLYPRTDSSASESTVHAGIYTYIPVYIPAYTSLYQYNSTYWYIPVHTSTYQHKPACTSMYWYVPACTVLSDTEICLKSVSGYITVQGSIWK
jgi:hypothetical protein